MKNTMVKAILFYLTGLFFVCALLFIPAGTFYFFGGLLLICVLFIPMLIVGIVLLKKSPKLLSQRLDSKEKQKGQGTIISLSAAMFILGFVLAGIDYRFGISNISAALQIVFSAVFLLGYCMYFAVLFQNSYLSRTIKVSQDQKVVDSGLYSIVRHPMYTSTIIMFLSMPLILGSYLSLIVYLVYPFLIVKRISLEEKLLENELFGYKEYKKKVKYKLFPFIW